MSIGEELQQLTTALQDAGITSARLDALTLLAYASGASKSWLLAHDDASLSPAQTFALKTITQRRLQREPLAYILGVKEFYGRSYAVTPDVLVPRPETEEIIEQVKALGLATDARVLDIGTGSGVIACTLALEIPTLHLTASDVSPAALKTARHNATALGAKVTFCASDILSQIAGTYHCIVANLPYVDRSWKVSPETAAEPELALFAQNNGLELIFQLIEQASSHLEPAGALLLEADPRQHKALASYAQSQGFKKRATRGFIVSLQNQ